MEPVMTWQPRVETCTVLWDGTTRAPWGRYLSPRYGTPAVDSKDSTPQRPSSASGWGSLSTTAQRAA